jgi:hypothetical protein
MTWKKGFFNILTKIKKFIKILKDISQQHRFRQMDENRFRIINDKAVDSEYYRFTEKMHTMRAGRIQKALWNVKLYLFRQYM